jgi:FkbM family methyltransferase
MSICFDIGANIGNWSLSNINNYSKIITVEASPSTYNKLLNNTKNSSNIIPVNKAISFQTGVIEFYEAQNDVFSTTNKDWLCDPNNRFYGHPFKTINVQTLTLDELIDIYGIPDLIKIDTEGGEYNTIRSLTKKVDNLCFEWASETKEINFNCLDYLEQLGFSKFYLQMEDNYTFRPNINEYIDKETIKKQLLNTINKKDWGMIWCK